MLGEKLRCLAQKRQILCVTHFVQVARCASDHFLVAKQTQSANAVTQITKLLPSQRELEFARMLGNIVE
jgi:DNA repair protein RecN (Recombination protein N)